MGIIRPGSIAGFNPSHLAAQNARWSALATGGGFFDLLGNGAGIGAAPYIYSAKGIIGGNVIASGAGVGTFTGKPAVLDAGCISAAIFQIDATSDEFTWLSTAGSGGTLFGMAGGGILVQAGGNYAILGSMNAANTPYFAAAALSVSTLNWVIVNLLSGQIQSGTTSGFVGITSSGTYGVGARGNQLQTYLSAGMYSANFLSLPQLLQFAKAPWAFWYPRQPNLVVPMLASPGIAPSLVPYSPWPQAAPILAQ